MISVAQKDLHYPLDKMVVTGNYGEIRPNHFHAGLDLRTDPSKNLPIYSIQDGYISRIKVSTYGYGKIISHYTSWWLCECVRASASFCR